MDRARAGAESAPPWIAERAGKAIAGLTPFAPFTLAFDRRSVIWVEDFLERSRTDPDVDTEGLVPVIGSFVGQCLAETQRGSWVESDGDWAVRVPASDGVGSVDAFPFRKTAKQARDGADEGESVVSLLDVSALLSEQPSPAPGLREAHGRVILDLPTYRSMVRATLGRTLWTVRALGGVGIVIGVASIMAVGEPASFALALLGVAITSYEEIAARWGYRRLRRQGAITDDKPWLYHVHEGGVGIHTPASDVQLRWDGIRRLRREPAAWVLTAAETKVPIPRSAFTARGAARVDDMVTARGH